MARASYIDAIGYLVRYLVRSATGMAANSVRPANQTYQTGVQDAEFATVQIISDEGDVSSAIRRTVNDTAIGSTKVSETLDVYHEFTASVQFFRHATPRCDGEGISAFGMSAFDRAARLQSLLMLSTNMELMEKMGLMFLGASGARNLSALVDGAYWEDRGSVDLFFGCNTSETVLLETMATAEIALKAQWPGGREDDLTIEVPS